jgi:hypothetical protein
MVGTPKEGLKECLKELVTSDIIEVKVELSTSVVNLKQFIPELKTEDAQFKYIDFFNNIITDAIDALHNEDGGFTCDPAKHVTEKKTVLYACTMAMVQLAYDEIAYDEIFFDGYAEAYLSIIAPLDVARRFLAYLTHSAMKYGITPVPLQAWSPLML